MKHTLKNFAIDALSNSMNLIVIMGVGIVIFG